MIGAGFLDQSDAGSLTRPSVTLTFGGGGGGGLGGLAGGIADAAGFGPGAGPSLADGLVSLRVIRGMAPEVDFAECMLVAVPGGPDLPAPGDGGSVALAAGDKTSAFACVVDLVESRPNGLSRLTATNGARLLARARVNLSFADQSPGAIIDALAAEVGVDSAAGNAGETLKVYVADDRRSVWDHVARLATTAGRLAGFDDVGSLTLFDDTATGEPVATFTVGETLIDYRIQAREAAVGALAVDGEGAGDKGGNSWAWLRKETGPMSATSGDGQPARRMTAPWVRGQPVARALADARFRSMGRVAASGWFVVQANPQVVPGSLITIEGTGATDGTWLTLGVDVRFDLESGLQSRVHAATVGGGGGSLAGLGGLP